MIKVRLVSLGLCLRNVLLTLAVLFIASQSIQAQWTNGTNINNTNPGNVGIGTTAPQAKLEVHHSSATTNPVNVNVADFPLAVRNTSNTNGNFSIITFIDSAGWGNAHFGAVQTDQAAHSADLFFSTRNAGTFAEKLRIKGDGKVGVGISSPSASFQLNSAAASFSSIGQFLITDSANTNRNLRFGYDATLEAGWIQASKIGTSYKPLLLNPNDGNVGIGATGPTYKLQVSGSGGTVGDSVLVTDSNTITTAVDIANTSTGAKKWRLQSVGSGISGRVGNFELVQTESDLKALVVQPGGTVGIGTPNPSSQYKLDVSGNINSTGTITGNNIVAKYQDVAEWVPAAKALPPGTVVSLNRTQSNFVEASTKAYDTRVAGVVSAQPGITLGERGENKVLVATTGRVMMKVDATDAPIEIGDLLVTSEKEGVAMKSVPVDVGGVQIHRPGTLIGKALEPLAKGQGEILVLLSLQ